MFAAIGTLLARALEGGNGRPSRALTTLLVGVHLVLAPVLLPLRGLAAARLFDRAATAGDTSLPTDASFGGASVVVVGSPDALITSLVFIHRALREDLPSPARSTLLTVQLTGEATVERTGERIIEVTNPTGECGGALSSVYRTRPFREGEATTTDLYRAEVIALTADGLPSKDRFTYYYDPHVLRRFVWKDHGLVEIAPPSMDGARTYPSTDFATLIR